MWTQSAAEGTRDSRVVVSRSLDGGESWTGPRLLASTENGRGVPAMFGFPVMSPGGRIYCLYNKHKSIVDLGFRVTAVLGCHYSDDDGRNWTDGGGEFGYGRTSLDHPDPKVPCNCICWQGPVLDGSGRPLVTVTHVSSREVYPLSAPNAWGVRNADSQGQLMRFENIDQSPEPKDLIIRWLPGKEGQLRYPHLRVNRSAHAAIACFTSRRSCRCRTGACSCRLRRCPAISFIRFRRTRTGRSGASLYRSFTGTAGPLSSTPLPPHLFTDSRMDAIWCFTTTTTAACTAAWGRGICGAAVPCSWPLVNFDRTEVNPYGSVSPSNSPIPMEWVLDRSRWSGWPCMPV